MKKNLLRKIIAFFTAAIICVIPAGCESQQGTQADDVVNVLQPDDSASGSVTRAYLPTKKADGSKFKIAYVDIDPYNEIFKMLYYVIENLKSDGWITYDTLPFDPDVDSDSKALVDWLADNAESEYLEFDKTANYYTTVSTEDEIYESLKQHIEVDNDIDIILAMGSSVSKMIQDFGFDVPLLMYGVSDPIGYGLINSAEDSGNDLYWAHVDSSAYSRQMQYYYDTFEFTNLGAVFGDRVIAAIDDYEGVAEENGFKMTEYVLDKDAYEDEEEYYALLIDIYEKMINEDKVDAYILNTNVITDVEKAAEIMQMFFDANIPVFAQVGAAYVNEGAALLIVDPRDASATGPFVSNIIGSVLNGALPGDLELEYASSPYLTLNLDVADQIEFKPTFEMLIACEKIICSE